jgi:hypothetical protein
MQPTLGAPHGIEWIVTVSHWVKAMVQRGPNAAMYPAAYAVLSALVLAMAAYDASAQSKPNQIYIEYVTPKNSAHRAIYEQMKQAEVLEFVQQALNSIRLPRAILFSLKGCDGVVNAWYDGKGVTVCYEYIDEILKNTPSRKMPLGITKLDVLAGPLLDVFMHEAAHAIFEILEVPIFGREEDAADQFSAYVMLNFDRDRARRLILGTAYQYTMDIQFSTDAQQSQVLALKKFSNDHGVPAQRFYNVLCVAYGADPKLFADVVDQNYLPKDRADVCEDEFEQVSFAFNKLIQPHLGEHLTKRLSKMRSKLKEPQ